MLVKVLKRANVKPKDYLSDIKKLIVLIGHDGIKDKDSLKNFAIAAYNLGNQFGAQRNSDKALKLYSIALEFNPDLQEAWTNIMGTYYSMKEYSKAVELGDKLLKDGKDRIRYFVYIGSLIELGQKEKAGKLLSEAEKQFGPDNLWQSLRLGLKEK
jgi:tetratricopeptide (TPR) repeat protein